MSKTKKVIGYGNAPFKKRDKDSGDIDLSCLVGKKVVAVGRIDQSGFPQYTETREADLAIDYLDGKVVRRIIIGATDLGWWTQWSGLRGTPSHTDNINVNN